MQYLCRCGRIKTGQPHHSSAVKRWICPRCIEQIHKVRVEIERILGVKLRARVVKLATTSDLKSDGA